MIRKLIAKIRIPKNTSYCHGKIKHDKNGMYSAKRCPYLTDKGGWEYCTYLDRELTIQDQVKDCGINEYRRD